MSHEPASKSLPTLLARLHQAYPEARYELNWDNPLQLLIATILAAQCTDERVNQVTPALFARYPDARSYAESDLEELEGFIRTTGFYHNKALAIQAVCRDLVEKFDGEVPSTMDEMLTLTGVARKTANVVLNTAFRIPSGVIVDTHVARVSQRLGLSTQKRPEKIERDLMNLIPQSEWITLGPALVLLGRYTCTHNVPHCAECILNDLCPKVGVEAVTEDASPAAPNPEEEAMPTARKTKAKAPAPRSAARKTATTAPPAAPLLPPDWQAVLAREIEQPYFQKLQQFVAQERQEHTVFPPEEDVFNAFKHTPFDQVKVLLLGQDPYHDDGQAQGLCFSVRPGTKPPPSLVNMLKELQSDLGCRIPTHGSLIAWARRGVLLLNTVLTVRAHQANSHKDRGWERFTDAAIRALNEREQPVVFALWGGHAQKKQELIDTTRHRVVTAAHPSPLSAKKFLGSRPYSAINQALADLGEPGIDWQLPDQPQDQEAAPAQPAPAKAPTPTPAVVSRPAAPAAPDCASIALQMQLPVSWRAALANDFARDSFAALPAFLAAEWRAGRALPSEEDAFNAFRLTPYDQVRVVLLGQEPSCVPGEADGLAFSVRPDVAPAEALTNLFHELKDDLGCRLPNDGSLVPWAKQGVLLLNTVLTVRPDKPGSHRGKGWEGFTDAVLRAVNALPHPVVFLLLGPDALKKRRLIDAERHAVVASLHPEERAFLGSRVFSAVNDALELRGQSAIYWQLPSW